MSFFFRWGLFSVVFLMAATQTRADPYSNPPPFNCAEPYFAIDYVICASDKLKDAMARVEEAHRAAVGRGARLEYKREILGEMLDFQEKDDVTSQRNRLGGICASAIGRPSPERINQIQSCALARLNGRIAYLNGLGAAPSPAPSTETANADDLPPSVVAQGGKSPLKC